MVESTNSIKEQKKESKTGKKRKILLQCFLIVMRRYVYKYNDIYTTTTTATYF